ncbi:MAG: hypothetical protein A3F72_03090 [Bacteroidetes bacterium RIFCSPLOWO2_12_FULL_35_15]|nr:MAG: hypothetical protein A3F72_03090 [Bacteroidetes bacterium RIFCSPLOWO2_12_FULL_35_15]
MTEISDFTKKAMELARQKEYSSGIYSSPIERENDRSINLRLTATDEKLIIEGLEALRIKSKAIVLRAKNFPSETIKSSMTIEKHEDLLDQIDHALSNFCDGLT